MSRRNAVWLAHQVRKLIGVTDPAERADFPNALRRVALEVEQHLAAEGVPNNARSAIAELQRSIFDQLAELDKTAPSDVDQIVLAIVSHLRAWKPVSIAPLGTLPAPTESIRDPRNG